MTSTLEQLRAIDERTCDVFVEAGAGTGKTALMVERYVKLVLGDHVPPEKVLTVTFTRKAAGELRSRIRAEFLKMGRPDMASLLDRAPIETIHGLCSRVLRAHSIIAGVDPAFSVMDEQQATIVRDRLAKQVWAELLAAASGQEALMLAEHRSDLVEGIPRLYERFRGLGREEPELRVEPAAGLCAARTRLDAALEDVMARAGSCGSSSGSAQNVEKAGACITWLLESRPAPDMDHLNATLRFWPSLTCGAFMKPYSKEFQDALAAYRAAVAATLLEPLAALADRFLQLFHARLQAEKDSRGLVDFADLELGCLRVLRVETMPFGPGCHLMVDEFQDTNQVQSDILERLGAVATLTVGDECQSIYGFRGADVEVFRRRRERLSGQEESLVCALTLNFRSRPAVLDVIARAFAAPELFGHDRAALQAARDDVAPRSSAPDRRGALRPAVEAVVVAGDEPGEETMTNAEREARAAARRVARLVREEGWDPRDVVILLRVLTHVDLFEEALYETGLTPYVVGGRGYLAHEELSDVRALLRVVANPRDDLALVTVLRSPLVGVSDDCLFLLAKSGATRGDGAFWPQLSCGAAAEVSPEDQRRLETFAPRVEALRRRVGRPGLAVMVEEAINAFDYDLVVLGTRTGRRRFANLRKLMTLAEQFEDVSGPDLSGFLDYLDHVGRLELREGSAAVLGEKGEAVRIMSIHQAKGLEFPVVVVAGLGSKSGPGRSDLFLVGKDGRAGLVLRGPERKSKEAVFSLGPVEAILAEKEAAEAEELTRVLYVGMTRAEERLLLILSVPEDASKWPGSLGGGILGALDVVELPEGEIRPFEASDLVVVRDVPEPLSGGGSLGPPEVTTGAAAHTAGATPPRAHPGEAPPAPPPCPTGSARRRVTSVSFSSLAAYARCPRKYYLERVLHVPGEPSPGAWAAARESDAGLQGLGDHDDEYAPQGEEGPQGRETGLIVHRVLERADLAAGGPPRDLDALVTLAAAEFRVDPGGAAAARALALAAAFWRSPLALISGLGEAQKERAFAFAHGGTLVKGVMDLLVQDDHGWRVVDFKTNRLPVAPGGLAHFAIHPPDSVAVTRATDLCAAEAAPFHGERGVAVPVVRLEEVAAGYRLQAEIYALAGLLGGAAAVTVSFLLLEEPEAPQSRTYRPEDVPALERALTEALAGLEAGAYPRATAVCAGCGYEELCAVIEEEVVAR